MRIILTCDLHYDIPRSRRPTEELAAHLLKTGGDLLVFVGDCAGADLAILEQVFGLFDAFSGRRLFVAGNHDLWTAPGGDSRHRYETELAETCARAGVHYLDAEPFIADGVAVVGNVGWYDYTFRPSALKIPLRFYQHKLAPGAAMNRAAFRHLIDGYDDLPLGAADITTRWMDGEYVRLGVSDLDFARAAADRLRQHLSLAASRAKRIVAAVHHLPFYDLVPHPPAPNLAFAGAFLGSELLGEALLEYPQVGHAYCGHAHLHRTCKKGGLLATCIGSTYTEKRYESLDV
jgi:hypothetical protein